MGGSPDSEALGRNMEAEMGEQPAVLRGLLASHTDIVDRVRRSIPDPVQGIVLVARGSSDNAAVFGRYVLESATLRPVSMLFPSLVTLYGVAADYRGWVAIGASQSGETPEIVESMERLRRAGASAVAITNDPSSPLAALSDVTVALGAGEEVAVPATKTFTSQLAAFALLGEAMGKAPWPRDALERVPAAVEAALADFEPVAGAAEALVDAPSAFVVGRGYMLAVALEAALKLKESAAVFAEGISAADLMHGPIAAVQPHTRVVLLRARPDRRGVGGGAGGGWRHVPPGSSRWSRRRRAAAGRPPRAPGGVPGDGPGPAASPRHRPEARARPRPTPGPRQGDPVLISEVDR